MQLDSFIRNCLPASVALAAERAEKRTLYELRLRADQPVQWIGSESGWLGGNGRLLPTPEGALITTRAMLEETLFRATGRSMQSAMAGICKGYVALPGGGRLGVVGTASTDDGQVLAVHTISALCFRCGSRQRRTYRSSGRACLRPRRLCMRQACRRRTTAKSSRQTSQAALLSPRLRRARFRESTLLRLRQLPPNRPRLQILCLSRP